MSAEESNPDASAPTPRDGLAEQLRQLEDFVAKTELQGGEMPPEAAEMIVRLREIMEALDGLSASFSADLSRVPNSTDAPERP